MTNQLTPMQSLAGHIEKRKSSYAEMLRATGTDIARFTQNALVAASDNPAIASGEVAVDTVLKVCSRAASDGLVLDGKEAAIVIGSVKKGSQWVKEAQYRQMIGGVMKMINRSPNIKFINVQLVHENDICKIDMAAEGKPVIHEIDLDKPRGDVRGCYAYAKLIDGEYTPVEYMTKAQIEAIRKEYAHEKSPMWIKSWGEAARKTVLHRAKKRWPIASDVEVSLRDDEKGEDITVIENEPAEEPKPKAKKTVKETIKEKMKAATEKPKEEPTPHDAETGEVVEAEFEEINEENNEMPI